MQGRDRRSVKVMLVRPPQQFYFGVWPRGPRLSIPTGLLAIGSHLRREGIEVTIYDAFVEGDDFVGDRFARRHHYKRPGSRRSLSARSLDYQESGSLQSSGSEQARPGLVHFGATWSQMREALAEASPDVVGITNLFRENLAETKRTARIAKNVLPNSTVVVGGPNANAQGHRMLHECPEIDMIGLGDGERIMLQLTELVAGQIDLDSVRGIVYRDRQGVIKQTPASSSVMDLDEYGPLDYDLIKLERYFAYEKSGIMARNKFLYPGAERAVSIVTSRGCPYSCTFCSVHIHAGKKFRRHSVEYLVAQIRDLVEKRGVRHIHFEDDNLALDRRRFVRFLEEVKREGLRFTWDTPNGVYAENLTRDVLRLMVETGCLYLIVGVESGDQWVLDSLVRKQPLKLATVERVFREAQDVGIDLHAFYIIGFPRETMEQIEQTLTFARRALETYDVVPHLSLARADPGTALYDEARSTSTLVENVPIANAAGVRADMFDRHLISTDEFTPEMLENINERFHVQCMRYVVKDRARFLLGRPVDLVVIVYYYLRDVIFERHSPSQGLIKLFWCKLLYKNSLRRLGAQARLSGSSTPFFAWVGHQGSSRR